MVADTDSYVQPVSAAEEVGARLWVLIVVGIPVGVMVAGVGSRLAMLLLRLTSPDRVRGLISDDGFEIGRFTIGGTYNLMVLGAVIGLIGVGAYRAVSPWLLGPVWFRRATVAAASGAVVGSMLVKDDGIDFTALKPVWLAVALFVALPAVFGVVVAAAVDRVGQLGWPTGWPAGWRRWVLPAGLVIAFPLAIPFVVFAAVVLAIWVPVRRGLEQTGGVSARAGLLIRTAWLGVAVLGLASLVGDLQALS